MSRIGGWPLVTWSALGVIAMSLTILAVRGVGEEGLSVVLRATGRVSLLLFLTTFVAAPAHRLVGVSWTRWLLHNRRYLGVSFAACHTIHLFAILALVPQARSKPSAVVILLGGLVYALMFGMAATSFDKTAAWLGRRHWRMLHTTGAYALWVTFALQYVQLLGRSAVYLPGTLLVFGALALRVIAWRTRRPAHA